MADDLAADRRILAHDANRFVLELHSPDNWNARPFVTFIAGIAGIVLTFLVVARFYFGARVTWEFAVLFAIAIFAGAAAIGLREGKLVALRDRDELFVEWRNFATGRKKRRHVSRLSELTGYEIRSHVDLDTDIFPAHYYELVLHTGKPMPVWYGTSKETARAIGEELLRLRPTPVA